MKKLLFVLTVTFIGQQSFSQQPGLYIVTLSQPGSSHPGGCDYNNDELCLTIIPPPPGTQTYRCIHRFIGNSSSPLLILHEELNNIIVMGYKLIETNTGASGHNGLIKEQYLNAGTTWYFAIP